MAKAQIVIGANGGGNTIYSENNVALPNDRTFRCGFKPKKILLSMAYNSGHGAVFYDEDVSKTTTTRVYGTGTVDYPEIKDDNSAINISSINSDGFTVSTAFSTYSCKNIQYIAVG